MSAKARIGFALVLAALAGCGESGAKRAADARTEALRFYAVDAPAVAVLGADPHERIAELDRAAGNLPTWTRVRDALLEPLEAAGLGTREVARLVRPRKEIEGVETAALAVGDPTPADLGRGSHLLVLVTDQADLLARLLRKGADAGSLQPAGELDEAVLYRSPEGAFAVRDGVLVSARRLTAVRAAIERRDGDSDAQLDEDVVESVFDELEAQGPLLVYADLEEVREADPAVRALAQVAPWTGSLGQAAASARPQGTAVRIEVVAKATGGDLTSEDLPVGATPRSFTISPSAAGPLLPRRGPIRGLLSGLAPVQGEATASSDDVRLQATVAP